MQKDLTTYFSTGHRENDKVVSIVLTLNEKRDGVELKISRKEGEVIHSDVKQRSWKNLTLSSLDTDDLTVIIQLFDDWLESDSKPTIYDTISGLDGKIEIGRHGSSLGAPANISNHEFSSVVISVGERSIVFSHGKDEQQREDDILDLKIPSAENVEGKRREDFKNILSIKDFLYDFIEKRYSDQIPNVKQDSKPTIEKTSIEKIEQIFNRFGKIHRQLKKRQRNRDPICINDEYDVQYLLHALLRLHFDDVRDESYLKQHAGKNPRIDFLIEEEKIGIETKFMGGRSRERIRNELAEDKEQYRSDPNCDILLCFIYDPNDDLTNPIEFEKDLAGEMDNLVTRVTVTQS